MQNKAKGGERRRKGRGSGGGEREEEVRSKTIRKKTALHFLLLTNYNMRWAPSEQDRCLEVSGPLDRGVDARKRKQATWQLKSLEPGAPPNRSRSPRSVIKET